jgi:hypothetical protein
MTEATTAPLAAADGTVAATRIDDALGQRQLQHHAAAMACQPVHWLDVDLTHSKDAHDRALLKKTPARPMTLWRLSAPTQNGELTPCEAYF